MALIAINRLRSLRAKLEAKQKHVSGADHRDELIELIDILDSLIEPEPESENPNIAGDAGGPAQPEGQVS